MAASSARPFVAAAAETTSARQTQGSDWIMNIIPIMPPVIEGWSAPVRGISVNTAATMPIAARRLNHGARLNASHQRKTASAHTMEPITAPRMPLSGKNTGVPNRTSHSIVTAATPGHRRREEGIAQDTRATLCMCPYGD
ncbi:MAG: hypothetical protein FJW31_17070 [Acidobacteria bacterium]|nr:hypothetical protein [Acidobacteriota bacterium]